MTPQERDLILAVAQRLSSTRLEQIDQDADRLIQSEIGRIPSALYLLTQAVIVQEQGLRHAQERIQQLESQVQTAQQQPHQGGFLSSLFGGGSTPAPPAPPPPPPPAPQAGPSAAGTFLRSAAATAAGVVGGQLIFDGLRNYFGGSSNFGGGAFGGGGFLGGGSPIVEENITNVYQQPASPTSNDTSSFGTGGDWGNVDAAGGTDDQDDSFGAGGDYDDDTTSDDEDDGDFDSDNDSDDTF